MTTTGAAGMRMAQTHEPAKISSVLSEYFIVVSQ